jgi:6-bladed beta-propeller
MRNLYNFLLGLILLFSFLTGLESASLKLVKTIGSDDDNYSFRRILGAVISKNKDIYVVDARNNFLARYDWNGKFIKKIGQFGQGPGDFNMPSHINQLNNKLYFKDGMNNRVAEVDLELKELKYRRIISGEAFLGDFFMLDKNRCVGNSISFSVNYQKEYKAIKILDLETQAEFMFFDKMPVKDIKPGKLLKHGQFFIGFSPCTGLDRVNEHIIVSFTFPNNPLEFFIYSYDGECVDQFTYNFDETFKYSEHRRTGKRAPDKWESLIISSIYAHKGHYIVFIGKTTYTNYWKREFTDDSYCLIFDQKTKELKHKIQIPQFLEFYSITEDGYLIGTKNFEEILKIYIYKLEL